MNLPEVVAGRHVVVDRVPTVLVVVQDCRSDQVDRKADLDEGTLGLPFEAHARHIHIPLLEVVRVQVHGQTDHLLHQAHGALPRVGQKCSRKLHF
jgi:hypothetical protein